MRESAVTIECHQCIHSIRGDNSIDIEKVFVVLFITVIIQMRHMVVIFTKAILLRQKRIATLTLKPL